MALTVGSKAPDFTLVDVDKKPRSLSEYKGKNVVLAFFPGAFTGVCTKELCTLRDSMSRFNELHAHVVGISVDSPFANKGFAAQNKIEFPLLSDYARTTLKAYDIVHEGFGGLEGYSAAKRSVFIVDKDGIVRYAWISDNPGVEPNYADVTAAVESLK